MAQSSNAMMNVEALHVVLQQSFSADATVRHPAEETIKNLKNLPGATTMLLQVAAEHQVRFEVRQAAAIQLKNICREGWAERIHYASLHYDSEPTTKPSLLNDADKEAVKQHMMEALLREPEKSIRDLLAETLHTVVIHDFPDKWRNLIPLLLSTIRDGAYDMANKGLEVHNALLALRKVCKRYEYKSKEQRGPLNEIVQTSFPLLLPLAQELSNSHSLEAAMMLKQILKIFWSSTQFYLPGVDGSGNGRTRSVENGHTQENGNPNKSSSIGVAQVDELQPWFDVLTHILQKPLPEATTGQEPLNQPVDIEGRNAWPWWKVKKWTVQIMSRLFSRYGIPNHADDEHAKNFAIYFSQQVAPQFLGPVCETLNLRPTGQFCTDRVLHLALTYVDLAVELAATYKMLKPHLEFLLYQVCFPTICLTKEDTETFENDPVEFVHKQNSPLLDFYDPRMSAITLVTDLVKQRGQDVTQNLLGRMTEILHRYAQAPAEQKNHIEKDGALFVFGSLSKSLMSKEKYAKEIEGLLVTSVFPDFTSPIAFLRYRACWMVQQYSGVKWTDDGSSLRTLLQMVLARLSDPALPVQIEASKALRFLLEADNSAEEVLLPVLPQLLTEYFRIMNEIGNDEVVAALQVLLDKFGDHIEPHAAALVTQLSNTFAQYCTAGEDDDDDDAALAAAQCLECISTVLKGVCGTESMIRRLEPMLVPLVLKILGNDGDFLEYLECALDILTFLTFFQSNVSMEVWQTFPLIYLAFDQWAYDYLNLMVPCIQSFIMKGSEVFLTGTAQLPEGDIPYIDLVISMVAKTVSNNRSAESECRHGLSLLMCMLHNGRSRLDNYLPYVNEISLGKLGQQVNADSPVTRISVYQVLGSALFYNPQLELAQMESRGVTQQVFTTWIADVPRMERWLPRKLTVLGFTSIFSLPTSSLQQSVVIVMPLLIQTALQLALALKDDAEKGETGANDGIEDEPEEGEDNAGAEDVDVGFNENEDVTNEVDEAYRKALSGVSGWENDDVNKFLLGDGWDEDNEDIDEDYTSPLDQMDELILLSDTLSIAVQREPEAYQRLQSAMSADAGAAWQRLFSFANSLRAQAAQQTQQS